MSGIMGVIAVGGKFAWQYVNASSATGLSTTTPSVTLSGLGITQGDLIVFAVTSSTSYTVTTPPSGYTSLFDVTGSIRPMTGYYKLSDGTETSVTLTSSASINTTAVLVYRNIAQLDLAGTSATASVSNGSISTLALATTGSADLVISFFSMSKAATASGITARVNSAAAGFYIGDENVPNPTTTTPRTMSWSGSGQFSSIAVGFKEF